MPENEAAIYENRDKYSQQLSRIEAYYLEKGGVGSPEFVAFGDALRSIMYEARVDFLLKEIAKGKDSKGRAALDEASVGSKNMDLICRSREEMYPEFFSKYILARQQIESVIRSSPYKNNDPYKYPHACNDLDNARRNIIKRSSDPSHS